MILGWLPSTERISYRRWRQQYKNPAHNRFCPPYHIVLSGLRNGTDLVNQKTANDECGEHDRSGVILLPDLHMDVVQGHVVLSSKH